MREVDLNLPRVPAEPARLRVLHVASGDLWAGAESQIYQLVRALSKTSAIDLHVVLLNEGELARRLRAHVDVTVLDEATHSSFQIAILITLAARRFRPDLIHTHRMKENVFGALAAKLVRAKCIRTAHGADEHSRVRKFSRRYIASQIDTWIGRYGQDKVVAVSQELATQLTQRFSLAKTHFIANGVSVELLRSRLTSSRGLIKEKKHIGLVGRLVPIKRADVFLRIAATLEDMFPGIYQFHVIGDGPLRLSLENQSVAMGISSHVEFHGFTDDALSLISQLSSVVMTSDHEGLPMVALESLALGVPIVAHNVGGLRELITTPKQGILIPTQDPKLFADAIRLLTLEEPRSQESRLDERFHADFMGEQYAALYSQLCRK